MVKPVLEIREIAEAKETLHPTVVPVTVVSGQGIVVSSSFVIPARFRDEESTPEDFTEDVFEDALDKVSRSVQGKYADVMPSTDEFIRQRREEEEAEAEERHS